MGITAGILSSWVGFGLGLASLIFIVPICIITGLHHAVFRMFVPKAFIWAIIACLGSMLGYLLPALQHGEASHIFPYFQIGAFIFITSWAAHKFTIFKPHDENWKFKRTMTIICAISGFGSIFGVVYLISDLIHTLSKVVS